MRSGPPLTPSCSFCGSAQADVALLFRSQIGGLPPFICDACVEAFHTIVEADRVDPELASIAVVTLNSAKALYSISTAEKADA